MGLTFKEHFWVTCYKLCHITKGQGYSCFKKFNHEILAMEYEKRKLNLYEGQIELIWKVKFSQKIVKGQGHSMV